MPRNTLNDLNNHLFMQLERLNDEDLKEEDLQKEISRAKAVSNIAAQIINNGQLALNAQKFAMDYLPAGNGDSKQKAAKKFPPLLRTDFLRE